MYVLWIKKAYDGVQRKVLKLAMRKKGKPEVLVRSLMSVNEGAKTGVIVDSELSDVFEVKAKRLK